jgi:superfamily II DNA/RNA helicase
MALVFTTVVAVEPDVAVHLESQNGDTYTLPIEKQLQLKVPQLSVGVRVRLRIQNDDITGLTVIQSMALSVTPASEAKQESSDYRPESDIKTHQNSLQWRDGVVSDLGLYRGVITHTDGSTIGFAVGPFKALALLNHDEVRYATDPNSGVVCEIQIVKRHVDGVGGFNLCKYFDDYLDNSCDPRIAQLLRSICSETNASWYWRTPQTAQKSQPADQFLPPHILDAFGSPDRPFEDLFSHQAIAYDALKRGRHVMVTTPTASGKTNCYNPRIIESLAGDRLATALYLFPLNALLGDQVEKLQDITKRLNVATGHEIRLAELRGGMQPEERKDLLARGNQIIATNPEMLSFLLANAHDRAIGSFFRHLRFVVLDEAHFYRGMLGLNMAGILRRLRIMCERQGNPAPGPQYILSSATVARPEDLAVRLTGIDAKQLQLISKQDNGRAQPARHWLMLSNPLDDAESKETNQRAESKNYLYRAAEALVIALTEHSDKPFKALLFVRSFRQLHQAQKFVVQMLTERNRADLIDSVSKYAGALLSFNEKKRRFSDFRNEAHKPAALIATNALEAGIDLGDLDICILAGFPQHVMRMRQMAGRACTGRVNACRSLLSRSTVASAQPTRRSICARRR